MQLLGFDLTRPRKTLWRPLSLILTTATLYGLLAGPPLSTGVTPLHRNALRRCLSIISVPNDRLILRDTGHFQRRVRDRTSLVEFVDNDTQRRIYYLHSGQLLRVKSVACLQWRTCLLASFKETFVARHSASLLLVVVSHSDFVSLNYSFIINKLFVLARTIDRLGSSEWVNKQFRSKINTTATQNSRLQSLLVSNLFQGKHPQILGGIEVGWLF